MARISGAAPESGRTSRTFVRWAGLFADQAKAWTRDHARSSDG
jgi:hypothetical protein